jgi:hypothetical protein
VQAVHPDIESMYVRMKPALDAAKKAADEGARSGRELGHRKRELRARSQGR